MSSPDVLTEVRRSLETIADTLDRFSFIVPRRGHDGMEAAREAIIEAVRKYLLHRLREPDAPVVAVLAGLSGVGKSTVLNSLAQDAISPPGIVRPTTTKGVLWAHRDHAARYWTEFVGRVREQVGPATDVVIGEDPLIRHLTFVDTPPLEGPVADGATAPVSETLMFADLCVFVTSVERYADAAPLGFLDAARARGVPMLFVLNRLPGEAGAAAELLTDFAQKLVAAGHLPEPDPEFIFGIEEASSLRSHGGLAADAVAPLRKELSEISDPDFRVVVIDEAAEATVRAVADRALSVAAALQVESADRLHLRSLASAIYEGAAARLTADIAAGEFASLADHDTWGEASLDLAGAITRAAGVAAEQTVTAWLGQPGGEGLLATGHEGLRRHGPDAAATARSELDGWMRGLTELVPGGRWWRSARWRATRMTDRLWRAALDPDRELRRRRGNDRAALDRVRELLPDAVRRALAADEARFAHRAGPELDSGLADRIREAATYLLEIPEAAPEPEATARAAHGG